MILEVTALVIVGWGAFVFTGIWLRNRCARELADLARQLEEVRILGQSTDPASPETLQINFGPLDVFATGPMSRAQFTVDEQRPWGSFSNRGKDQDFTPILERLQALQAFSPRTVGRELFGGNNSDGATSVDTPSPGWSLSMSGLVLLIPGKGRVWLSEFSPPPSVFRATDAAGQSLYIITRPKQIDGRDPDVDPSWIQSTQELVVVDSSGNIASPIASPVGILLGKLPDPLGTADQLVFGNALRLSRPRTGKTEVQPVVVCIIEHSELKVIRQVIIPDRTRPTF
jgi:hypothetical protein